MDVVGGALGKIELDHVAHLWGRGEGEGAVVSTCMRARSTSVELGHVAYIQLVQTTGSKVRRHQHVRLPAREAREVGGALVGGHCAMVVRGRVAFLREGMVDEARRLL